MNGGGTSFLASLAAFAVLSAAAGAGLLQEVDSRVLRAVQSRPSGALDAVGSALSVPGRAEVSAVALAALAVGLRAGGRGGLGGRLLVALLATTAVEIAAKFAIPQMPISTVESRVPDPSILDFGTPYPYPSGHMLRIVLLLGAVYVLWPNRMVRPFLLLALAGAAAARVYLGTHWPSDVLGGALLGLAGLLWAFGAEGPGGDGKPGGKTA